MSLSLFYKNVTVLDYAYFDKEKGFVGNSLHIDVEFVGETDDEGVIFDFSLAKKAVKKIIDDKCDHRLVLPQTLAHFENDLASVSIAYGEDKKEIFYKCPAEGVCEIPFDFVSYENIKKYLETIVLAEMPKTVKEIKLTLREEVVDNNQNRFQYTHGLKDHYGNCQRLFHGHQNIVEVFVNDQKRRDLEEFLSKELFNSHVHFVFYENIINKDEVVSFFNSEKPEGCPSGIQHIHLKYKSIQGDFEAKVPGTHCYIFQSETTVENLSMEFTKIIKNKLGPTDKVSVRAYEGIAKGAISYL